TEQKLFFWLATATCVRGWVALRAGELDSAIGRIQHGLGILQAIGIRATHAYYLSFLAEAHLAQRATAPGLTIVDEALASCETSLDRFYEPELYRLRGELGLVGGDRGGAERDFQRALAIARARQGRWFELRAALSLARLWRDDGAVAEAAALVGPVYGSLTEGQDVGDGRAARAFLDECAAAGGRPPVASSA